MPHTRIADEYPDIEDAPVRRKRRRPVEGSSESTESVDQVDETTDSTDETTE